MLRIDSPFAQILRGLASLSGQTDLRSALGPPGLWPFTQLAISSSSKPRSPRDLSAFTRSSFRCLTSFGILHSSLRSRPSRSLPLTFVRSFDHSVFILQTFVLSFAHSLFDASHRGKAELCHTHRTELASLANVRSFHIRSVGKQAFLTSLIFHSLLSRACRPQSPCYPISS